MAPVSTATIIPAGYRAATDADELPAICPLCGRNRVHDLGDYEGYGTYVEWYDCGCPDVVAVDDDPDPDPASAALLPYWESDLLDLSDVDWAMAA